MAWIACDVSLPNNPKTLDLADLMTWTAPETVGRLHMLWGWCLEFADDGDLSRFQVARVAQAMGLPAAEGDRLIRALIDSKWVDETPYLRVHDWWSIIGRFLKGRYASDPERWKRIQRNYDLGNLPRSYHNSAAVSGTDLGASVAVPDSTETLQRPTSNSAKTNDKLDATVQNILVHNNTEQHQPQHQALEEIRADDAAEVEDVCRTSDGELNALKREIIRSAGMRRFSVNEDQLLVELLKRHGPRVLEACSSLHSRIDNVVAYLTRILDQTDGTAELARRTAILLKKEGIL